jgi:hypothetical protein
MKRNRGEDRRPTIVGLKIAEELGRAGFEPAKA